MEVLLLLPLVTLVTLVTLVRLVLPPPSPPPFLSVGRIPPIFLSHAFLLSRRSTRRMTTSPSTLSRSSSARRCRPRPRSPPWPRRLQCRPGLGTTSRRVRAFFGVRASARREDRHASLSTHPSEREGEKGGMAIFARPPKTRSVRSPAETSPAKTSPHARTHARTHSRTRSTRLKTHIIQYARTGCETCA